MATFYRREQGSCIDINAIEALAPTYYCVLLAVNGRAVTEYTPIQYAEIATSDAEFLFRIQATTETIAAFQTETLISRAAEGVAESEDEEE